MKEVNYFIALNIISNNMLCLLECSKRKINRVYKPTKVNKTLG